MKTVIAVSATPVWDRGGHDVIVGGDAIGDDQQQVPSVHLVQVHTLPAAT
jgi:hypothetical protein